MQELEFLKEYQFKAEKVKHGIVLIYTPFMFEDGDMLTIYAFKENEKLTYSDGGSILWQCLVHDLENDIDYSEVDRILDYFDCIRCDETFKKIVNQGLYSANYGFWEYLKCLISLMFLLKV